MTRHTVNVMVLTTGLSAMGGALLWQLSAGEPASFQVGLVSDHSMSQARRCGVEEYFAGEAFDKTKGLPGSSFRAFSLGGPLTANEPELLDIALPPYTPPKVLSGRANNDRTRASFLSSMRVLCEAARPRSVSPVYIGLKSVVDDVRNQGPTESTRVVYVHSDMQDNVTPAIRAALRQKFRSPLVNMPPKIDNHGVRVQACGYDETLGTIAKSGKAPLTLTRPRRDDSTDRLKEVWRSLFTNPELVQIAGYCSASGTGTAQRALHERGER